MNTEVLNNHERSIVRMPISSNELGLRGLMQDRFEEAAQIVSDNGLSSARVSTITRMRKEFEPCLKATLQLAESRDAGVSQSELKQGVTQIHSLIAELNLIWNRAPGFTESERAKFIEALDCARACATEICGVWYETLAMPKPVLQGQIVNRGETLTQSTHTRSEPYPIEKPLEKLVLRETYPQQGYGFATERSGRRVFVHLTDGAQLYERRDTGERYLKNFNQVAFPAIGSEIFAEVELTSRGTRAIVWTPGAEFLSPRHEGMAAPEPRRTGASVLVGWRPIQPRTRQ
jgi:hypothetical protein